MFLIYTSFLEYGGPIGECALRNGISPVPLYGSTPEGNYCCLVLCTQSIMNAVCNTPWTSISPVIKKSMNTLTYLVPGFLVSVGCLPLIINHVRFYGLEVR